MAEVAIQLLALSQMRLRSVDAGELKGFADVRASRVRITNAHVVGATMAAWSSRRTKLSSPGFESFFPTIPTELLADTFTERIGPLVSTETASRGFMFLTATPAECRADWHVVSSVKELGYAARIEKSLPTFPGTGNRHLIPAESCTVHCVLEAGHRSVRSRTGSARRR